MRDKKRSRTGEPNPKHATFDDMFRATARRALKRHGVPANRIDAEIERLRKVEPVFSGPSFDEVMAATTASGAKR